MDEKEESPEPLAFSYASAYRQHLIFLYGTPRELEGHAQRLGLVRASMWPPKTGRVELQYLTGDGRKFSMYVADDDTVGHCERLHLFRALEKRS